MAAPTERCSVLGDPLSSLKALQLPPACQLVFTTSCPPSYLNNSSTSYLVKVSAANTAGDVVAPEGCTLKRDNRDTAGGCAAIRAPHAVGSCGVQQGGGSTFQDFQASSLPKSHPTAPCPINPHPLSRHWQCLLHLRAPAARDTLQPGLYCVLHPQQ
jgi:hypothetical protein